MPSNHAREPGDLVGSGYSVSEKAILTILTAELVASQFDSSPAQKHDTPWAGSWTEAAKNASEAIKAGFICTTQSRNDYSQKRGFRNSPYPR